MTIDTVVRVTTISLSEAVKQALHAVIYWPKKPPFIKEQEL